MGCMELARDASPGLNPAEPSRDVAALWAVLCVLLHTGNGESQSWIPFLSLAPAPSQQGSFPAAFPVCWESLDLLELLVLGTAPRADLEPAPAGASVVCLPLLHYLLDTAVMGTELDWNCFLNPGC